MSGAVGGTTALTGLTITTDVLTAPAIALATNGALSITNGGASEITGIISGTGVSLTKAGAGTLTLSAANTYTGDTLISAGTLALNGSGVLTSSSKVTANGTLSIGGLASGTSIKTLAGSGYVTLGNNTLTLAAANDTFSGAISGAGGLTLSAGTLTLAGTNSYAGLTTLSAGTLVLASNNALSGNALLSNDATLSATSGVTLPSLTVNGVVKLGSSIKTSGNMLFNDVVKVTYGNAANPLTLTSTAGDITFMSNVIAPNNNKTQQLSLKVVAAGNVEFNDRVGEERNTKNTYGVDLFGRTVSDLYNLDVTAAKIYIKADITTMANQYYHGKSYIGDNGRNGVIRTLISVDPVVEFDGTVDDTQANTHTLTVLAIKIDGVGVGNPEVKFMGDVGVGAALYELKAITDIQKIASDALLGEAEGNPYTFVGKVTIAGAVSTFMNQTFSGNNIALEPATTSNGVIAFTTKKGKLFFLVGKDVPSAPGVTATAGTKVVFKFSNASAINSDSLRNLKASGMKVQTPVFDYEDAARSDSLYRAVLKGKAPVKSSVSPTVTVGDALISDCVGSKDCDVLY
jgi:autotransporter-associated beta strand protein